MPGAYAPPRGRLLLAGDPGEAFGCIALRPMAKDGAPIAAAPAASGIGEVKRLYGRRRIAVAAAGGAGSRRH